MNNVKEKKQPQPVGYSLFWHVCIFAHKSLAPGYRKIGLAEHHINLWFSVKKLLVDPGPLN